MTRRRLILLFSITVAIGVTALLLLPRLTRAEGGIPLMRSALSADLGTAFTYQGYLEEGGVPAEGAYDFRFYLWEDSAKGSLVASHPLTDTMPVTLNEGLFTVALDFGERAFNGQERWLEIEVNGVPLTPLQQLSPAPYALSLRPGATIAGENEFKGMLNLENSSGPGLRVTRAGGPGVEVISSDLVGIHVTSAAGDGMKIVSALDEGLEITSAGDTGVVVESATVGFRVGSSAIYGLKIDQAGSHGIVVDSADQDGIYVKNATYDGLAVISAGLDGLFVSSAGDDGLNVCRAGNVASCVYQDLMFNGVEIGNAEHNGVYVGNSGSSGLHVETAAGDGLSICKTGAETTCSLHDDLNNGVEVGSVDSYGYWVDQADAGGVYVNETSGVGVNVFKAGFSGFSVDVAGWGGFSVGEAGTTGVYVGSAGYDGLEICTTGTETTCDSNLAENNGVEIGSTEHNGVYIDDAGTNGLSVTSAGEHGVYIGSTVGYGMVVEGAGTHGVAVASVGDSSNFFQGGPVDTPLFYVTQEGVAYATSHDTSKRDFAEMMPLAGDPTGYEPGDVLVVSSEQDWGVALSSEAYARAVIGVFSTAPGFIGGYPDDGTDLSGIAPVALLGIVPTKVSAENGPIQRGDLLVTSTTPGHAMRADDPPPGTMLGKALETLESGTGVILVLVTLQ